MNKKRNPFKFNKNSMVNYVRNMREDLNESAFTLIELIVVMAILAILVLLAAPQFLGYTSRANDAQIQNDTAVVESMVTEGLVLDELVFDSLDTSTLTQSDLDDSTVYNKTGKLEHGIIASDYKEVPSQLVDKTRTQLDEKGTFYTDKDGNVIFVIDGGSAGSEDGQPNDEFGDGGENQNPDDSGNEAQDPSDGSDNEEVDYGGYDELGVDGVAWVNEMIDQKYVMAEDDDFYWANEWWGDGWRYTGDENKIIIPMYIKGELVTSHEGMFGDLSKFNKLSVASNNPNVKSAGWMVNSSTMTELDLSEYDTSNVTNMSGMFGGSYSLTKLDLSGFDTSNVTNMSDMFSSSNITELDLSGFDTSNVTDMSNMFLYSGITKLDLSGFDTSKVTDMSSMFESSSVTELDLSGFDTSNVTDMGQMFNSTPNLKTLDLSGFDTSNVTNMNFMFSNSDISHLDLRSFAIGNATNMMGILSSSAIETVVVSTQDIADILNSTLDWGSPEIKFTVINN